MSQVTEFAFGAAKNDCEALEVEILLLQGKPLEHRTYRISRTVHLCAPMVLPPKTTIATAVKAAVVQKAQP